MVANTENSHHQELVGFIWSIADKLRGPYRPPQYRRVMLPLIVLRRLDAVLEPTKTAVLEAKVKYEGMGLQGDAFEKAIAKVAIGGNRQQPLYNLSEFTFQKLLQDSEGIADNLRAYINGFSPLARDIFEKFEFDNEIQKLDEANRLFEVMKAINSPEVNLSPAKLSNLQMGYLFEELVRLYGDFEQNGVSEVESDGQIEKRVCSKIFDNREFGFIKITVERPLRLNFQVSEERLSRLWEQTAFQNLATTKKRKDEEAQQLEIKLGESLQNQILNALRGLDDSKLYMSRAVFVKDLERVLKSAGLKLKDPVIKAILAALGEADSEAEICRDKKGNPEPDSNLRDTEIVPLPDDITLPLPLGYDKDASVDELIKLVKGHCQDYLEAEVLPHVPDAWIDFDKTKVGYEIPLNRHFYVYQPPRPLDEIENDIKTLESDIMAMLGEVV